MVSLSLRSLILQCSPLTSRIVIRIRHTLTLQSDAKQAATRIQGERDRTKRNHFLTQLWPETGCKHINLYGYRFQVLFLFFFVVCSLSFFWLQVQVY